MCTAYERFFCPTAINRKKTTVIIHSLSCASPLCLQVAQKSLILPTKNINMSLIEKLNWRYAVKRMNGQKVNDEQLHHILDAIRLAPSSLGLQPYTILVVENPELRKQIQPIAYNQPQITEASHLLIFAAWENITEEQIEQYINLIASERAMPVSALADFKNTIQHSVQSQSGEQLFQWNARQTYIALGIGVAAAALENVDATPMEGFDHAAVDALLGLPEKGLRSLAFLTLGFRDEANDFLAKAKKVRRKKDELFSYL
jgi:nitroreductase